MNIYFLVGFTVSVISWYNAQKVFYFLFIIYLFILFYFWDV